MSEGWKKFKEKIGKLIRIGGEKKLGDKKESESESGEKSSEDEDWESERKKMKSKRKKKEKKEWGDKSGKIGIKNGGKGEIKERLNRMKEGIEIEEIIE